ncbi:hypothetical protein STRDD11_01253 [Streptococcus sp. DD11]|uniref:TipC family immunity protein n=1 Tax=Streptococcus sp. DD11 TaxID=1777879 RepID=UPI000797C17F|nr:TipC family immunity protein [Streptococcus sp. DD11]KXT83856.1 hypothetical protein STRDD11_01253 [Streptococcus sp. DD11]
MKKKSFLSSLLALLTLVAVFAFFNWRDSQIKNIFAQIYSEQKSAYPSPGQFFSSKAFTSSSFKDTIYDFKKNTFRAQYKEGARPANYSKIVFDFDFKPEKRTFRIWLYRTVHDNVTVFIAIHYDVDKKILKKSVDFIERQGEQQVTIENETDLRNYLKQHNITKKDLDSYYDEIVNQNFLRSWTEIYDSRFSPEDYGEVKIETQWADW